MGATDHILVAPYMLRFSINVTYFNVVTVNKQSYTLPFPYFDVAELKVTKLYLMISISNRLSDMNKFEMKNHTSISVFT